MTHSQGCEEKRQYVCFYIPLKTFKRCSISYYRFNITINEREFGIYKKANTHTLPP